MATLERGQVPIQQSDDFAEVARLHRNLVFAIAARIVRNQQAAEDVTQETLIRAFNAWPLFRGDCDPRSWLARVATNVAINHVTRSRESPGAIVDRAGESDVAGQIEHKAMCKALRGAIDQLPPSLRHPLVMFEYDGMGCQEIGKRLGISEGAVRVRLLRGRRHLTVDMSSWR